MLDRIKTIVMRQQQKFDETYQEVIIPELAEEKVFLISERQLNVAGGEFVRNFFKQEILPRYHLRARPRSTKSAWKRCMWSVV